MPFGGRNCCCGISQITIISGEEVQAGSEAIAGAATTVAVVFGAAMSTAVYSLSLAIRNEVDGAPVTLSYTITQRLATGFTILLSGATPTANYILDWIAIVQ